MPVYIQKLSFFSKGRLNRLGYARNSAIAAFLAFLPYEVALPIALFIGDQAWSGFLTETHIGTNALLLIFFSFLFLGLAIHFSAAYQRFHDLNMPGYYWLLAFVPFANIYFWFKLLFTKGTDGINKYGEEPLSVKYPWVIVMFFILAFMLVVIFRFAAGTAIN